MDSFAAVGSNAGQGIPAALGATGTLLGFIGNMGAASAAKRAAESSRVAAELEAAQYLQQAGQAVAGSQREAMTERRKAALLASRGLAIAAASGGGATDPTVSKLLADISGEGSYRASLALYAGEEKKRQLEFAGAARRYEGQMAEAGGKSMASAYQTRAFGSLLTGGSSLYGKYGLGGPKKASSIPAYEAAWTEID